MILIGLLGLSAEIIAGMGQAAPNERATCQTPYGEVDWGYHFWTNFFLQATYVKGAWFGIEPYVRFGYMNHPAWSNTLYYNGYYIGTTELNESVTSYEMGFSRPVDVSPPLHLYWGGAFTGNFCKWERVIYKYPSDLETIDQATLGLVAFTRAEWWWKSREYMADEASINWIVGFSARFHYMGFRPEVWPCPDWFGVFEAYVGVRW